MRKRLTIAVLALAAAVSLTACSPGEDNAAPETTEATANGVACNKHVTSDGVESKIPADAERKPATLTPTTGCDEAIEIKDGVAVCSQEVASFTLRFGGPDNKGWLGQPVAVSRIGTTTQIGWGQEGGHALIINGTKWGFVDGIGLGGKTDPMPSLTILNDAEWGEITPKDRIEVCFSAL